MKRWKDNILVCLKGYIMGAANVIPGVSGGTMAVITGIYSEIIDSLDAFVTPSNWKILFKGRLKEFWARVNGTFLIFLALGIGVSIFSLAKLATLCLDKFPVYTWAFFFGLILASCLLFLREAKKWKLSDFLVVSAGITVGLAICSLSPTSTEDTLFSIFWSCAIAICAMILPGISGSFILVILGKYDYLMEAIGSLNIPVIAAAVLGSAAGLLAFAKLLHFLLDRWENKTLLALLGFMIGTLPEIWPWKNEIPGSDSHIAGGIIWILVGMAVIAAIKLLSRRKPSTEV